MGRELERRQGLHALFVIRALNGDYGVWGGLQALTIHHSGVAIVGIHHQRKGAAEDVLDTVLGSQSVTGVADTILVLKKSRGQGTGRRRTLRHRT